MKIFLKIFVIVFIFNSCLFHSAKDHDAFVSNQTSDSITISFDAYFVKDAIKKDLSKQQIRLVPVSTDRDFNSDSLYFIQAREIQNPALLPYVLCGRAQRRNAADTGSWISKYNSRVYIQYRIESMIKNCISLDSLNDSTAHVRLTIPSYADFELGRIGKTLVHDSYFKNFTVAYKDPKDKIMKVKYYENYGQLKKDFQKFGENDSALIVE